MILYRTLYSYQSKHYERNSTRNKKDQSLILMVATNDGASELFKTELN